ncbi:MAG: hypothetical protein ACXIUQ_14955 [Cecembia sp.]
MAKNNFNDLSIDELNSKLKSIKAITSICLGVLIFIVGMMIYGYINLKGNTAYFIALFAGLVGLVSVLPIQMINIKRINAEMNSRGN